MSKEAQGQSTHLKKSSTMAMKKKDKEERDKMDEKRQKLIDNILTQVSSTKSTNIDAQRVLNVIELTIKKVQILMYIDNKFIQNWYPNLSEEDAVNLNQLDEEYLNQLSPTVKQLLDNQGILEKKYDFYFVHTATFEEGNKNDQDDEEQQEEPKVIKKAKRRCQRALQNNTRNLIRELLRSEHDFMIIKSLKEQPNNKYTELVKNLKSLRVIMLKKIGTAAEEEKRHKNQLKELKERIQDNEIKLQGQQNTYNGLKKKRDEKSLEQKADLKKLNDEIKQIQDYTKKFQADLKRRDEAIKVQKKDENSMELTRLQEVVETEESELKEQRANNQTAEQALQNKIKGSQRGIESIIQAYDDDMKQKTEMKQQLDIDLQKCIEELNQLRKDNADMEAKKVREKKIADKWAQQKRKFELMIKRKERAAQALFLNYKDHKRRVKPKKKGRKRK